MYYFLEEEQFAPEIEPHANGFRITLGNCPYRAVAHENLAVCNLDRHIISEVLGTPFSNTYRIDLDNHVCIYDATFDTASSNPAQVTTSP